jgi:hypothetical protein
MGRITEASWAVLLSLVFVLSVSSGARATVYGAISGTVIAEDTGQGVSGLSVLAVAFSPGSQTHHYAATDANGIFVLKDLEPGAYAISFKGPDSLYIFDAESLMVTLPVGKNVVNANYVLKLGGSVSGAAYDSDGVTPLANAWVSALVQDSLAGPRGVFKARLTAGDGRFLLQGLPQSDSCVVQLSVHGHAVLGKTVAVTAGSTTHDVNFLLKWDDVTGVMGHVTSSVDGSPIGDAEIVLRGSSGEEVGNAYTDAAGGYSITGVPPGVYSATAYWPTGEFDNLHQGGITIASGSQVPLDFQFNAPGPHSQGMRWNNTEFGGFRMPDLFADFYPDYPDPKFHGCSAGEKDNLNRAFNRIKQWVKFDPCIGPTMRNKLKEKLAGGIRFFCVSSADKNECSDTWGFTYVGAQDVYLCRDLSLSSTTPEWCLESTILHELVHTVGYYEEPMPRKCDKACFDSCSAVRDDPYYNQYAGCSCE